MGVAAPPLSMWVIYDHPEDLPGHVVARRHEVTACGAEPTNDVLLGDTVDAVRDRLPRGLFRLPRNPRDARHIVEVWL